jgi:hypothetical protein
LILHFKKIQMQIDLIQKLQLTYVDSTNHSQQRRGAMIVTSLIKDTAISVQVCFIILNKIVMNWGFILMNNLLHLTVQQMILHVSNQQIVIKN